MTASHNKTKVSNAPNSVLRTLHGDSNRNLMKKVAYATIICHESNGTTVILSLNDFVNN